MTELRFGESSPFSLGVEEELMIVEPTAFRQVPAVRTLVEQAEGCRLPGIFKTELFASVVELATQPCATAQEAVASLASLRQAAAEIAARDDLRIAAAGTHPLDRPEDQAYVDEPRYEQMVAQVGITARRQGVQGLHLHVGMPDAEACLRALETVLPWLPVVLALSANSPYVAGRETGMRSSRAEILAQLPRSGAPPRFASWSEWEQLVARYAALGIAADYTAIWWDVRPHPRFGTLEIRVLDQPTSLALTGAFVALLQALCAAAVELPPAATNPHSRPLYQHSRWAAARLGPQGELVHPNGEGVAPAAELAVELLALVEPFTRRLGTAELLAPLDVSTCEADRQLAVGAAGGLEAVCADIVERTAADRHVR